MNPNRQRLAWLEWHHWKKKTMGSSPHPVLPASMAVSSALWRPALQASAPASFPVSPDGDADQAFPTAAAKEAA
jgi:hypothetical protein